MFPRISFDLIYARPGQTLAAWRAELRQALALAADHLSLYQLTIEPGTKFEAMHRRGEIVLPDEDTAAALYEATAEEAGALRAAGLRGVELRGAGRREPAQPRLLALWRLRRHRAGAHGRIVGALATRRHRAPEPWAERVERDGHGTVEEVTLQPMERASEMLLMGLRLTEGIDAARFALRTGILLEDALEPTVLRQALEEELPRMARRPSGRDIGGAAAAGCAVGCDRPLIPAARTVDSNVNWRDATGCDSQSLLRKGGRR